MTESYGISDLVGCACMRVELVRLPILPKWRSALSPFHALAAAPDAWLRLACRGGRRRARLSALFELDVLRLS